MADKTFDQDKFRDLLKKAIGARTQNTFAEIAGISKSRLNHLLNDDKAGIPNKGTLSKIAETSEGRVTEEQLLAVCGYTSAASKTPDNMSPQEFIMKTADNYKEGIEHFSGVSTKYSSIDDFLDTINILYGPSRSVCHSGEEQEFEGRGRKGAEQYVHCNISYKAGEYLAMLSFILFYCKTAKGGVVISDCAFDMGTLIDLHNPDAGRFLFNLAEKGDVKYTDYPMVLQVKKRDLTREERLLKAIFGEED